MKSVLITGVAGYIGSNLAYYLLNKNFKVIGVDDFSNSKKNSISDLKKYKNFHFFKKDVVTLNKKFFSNKVINHIVHLASISSVEKAKLNHQLTYRTNILGLENVIQIAKKSNCKSFIFASSAAVYGNVDKLPIRESQMKKPCSFYGFSKNINEEQIKYYSKELSINFFVLRLFNIYGGNNSLNNNFGVISKWIKNINLNRNIVLDNRGKCTRDFVYIDDLLRVIINIFSKKKINLLYIM